DTIFKSLCSLLFTDSSNPFASKKSPTKTATLFFHSAFTENNPLRSLALSTTSSCTKDAVCSNSTKEAPRYVDSLIEQQRPAEKKTNIGRICLPFCLYKY